MSEANSSKPNPELKLPETVSLNGQLFNVKENPELQNLIITAARIEKNKLYSQISNISEQVKALSNVTIEPAQQQTASPDLDAFEARLIGSVSKIIDEKIAPLTAKTGQLEQDTVQSYRDKIIKENIDKCIPEMIKGDTKEAIDAALIESIAVRQRFPSANVPFIHPDTKVSDPLIKAQAAQMEADLQEQTSTAQQVAAQSTKPVIPAPSIPAVVTTEPRPTEISKLSQDEFVRRRDDLFAQLQTLV